MIYAHVCISRWYEPSTEICGYAVSATRGSQNNYLPHVFGYLPGAWRIRTLEAPRFRGELPWVRRHAAKFLVDFRKFIAD